VCSSRICLIQKGSLTLIIVVYTRNEGGDTKGTDTSLLSIFLLNLGEVSRQVIDRRRIFHGQSVRLGFYPYLIDQDAGIGGQAGKGQDAAIVDRDDLSNGSGVLQSEASKEIVMC